MIQTPGRGRHTWDYRLIIRNNKIGIYLVDYNYYHKILRWTENPTIFNFSNKEGVRIRVEYVLMHNAFDKPILDYNTGKELLERGKKMTEDDKRYAESPEVMSWTSSWNYRLMSRRYKSNNKIEVMIGLYEVYYDRGDVNGWTENPTDFNFCIEDDFKNAFTLMGKALDKPILDYRTGLEPNDFDTYMLALNILEIIDPVKNLEEAAEKSEVRFIFGESQFGVYKGKGTGVITSAKNVYKVFKNNFEEKMDEIDRYGSALVNSTKEYKKLFVTMNEEEHGTLTVDV